MFPSFWPPHHPAHRLARRFLGAELPLSDPFFSQRSRTRYFRALVFFRLSLHAQLHARKSTPPHVS